MKRIACILALLLLPSVVLAGETLSSTDSIEVITSAAGSVTYASSFVDVDTTASTPGVSAGSITTATTTTVVAAPAASTGRAIKMLHLYNVGAANTITVQRDVSATNRVLKVFTLCVGCSADMNESGLWTLYSASGLTFVRPLDTSILGGSRSFEFLKIGTASEAVAIPYAFMKDSGLPGASVPGTPGLNGATADCTSSGTTTGSPILPNPTTGGWYLTDVTSTTSTGHYAELYDIQWYNTGLAITTTTNQAITFPTPVSRDADGAALGAGVQAGIYVLTTLGNGAVTNTTLTYTDQDGNGSATATMASMPATANAGTLIPFQLAAGDSGVRSIQGVTLGTTYVSGTISLVTYRTLKGIGNPVANVGGYTPVIAPGVRIWNGTCFQWRYISSATTATTLNAVIQLTER